MKKALKNGLYIAVGAALLQLTACSNVEAPEPTIEPVQNTSTGNLNVNARPTDSQTAIFNDYNQYKSVLSAIARDDDSTPAQFLANQQGDNAMAERVRNNWLKRLGARQNWALFQQQYSKLDKSGIDQENQCYADLIRLNQQGGKSNLIDDILIQKTGLNAGCNALIAKATGLGQIKEADAWGRVRYLLSKNQVSDARRIAAAMNQPLPASLGSASGNGQAAQEAALFAASNPKSRNNVLGSLANVRGSLNADQVAFAYGLAGLTEAKNQNFQTALNYFLQADTKLLDEEQWQWFARSALRLQNWEQIKSIVLKMPAYVQKDETWQYWLGRAYQAQGNQAAARQHFANAEKSGRNFYALLALEAMGGKVNTTSNAPKSSSNAIQTVSKDGAINRALILFQQSQNTGDWNMRREAQNQWRFAVRNYNETSLIASSELAHQNAFNEMTIYSADRTNQLLNYPLRFLSPYREITERYAPQANVDPAWVYGLIRQESRFMLSANSHVGATGLMQIMPGTGRDIARKLGMSNYSLSNIDDNIRMGTWYLGDIRTSLGSEVLATAGYNAGPGRARRWQANTSLEGAIYAETIPFNETRDYVKKVMTNATYYASLFNEPQTSLTQRMGTIATKR